MQIFAIAPGVEDIRRHVNGIAESVFEGKGFNATGPLA
jgi:hypothetical protein